MLETRRIDATVWAHDLEGEEWEGERVVVEAERTDVNEVAIHTFDRDTGRGSIVSVYFDREAAIDFATTLLEQCRVGVPAS